MDIKFNSLFDNEIIENAEDYYTINTKDKLLELNDLLLTFDKQKLQANKKIFDRNFGNIPNLLLSGRPCSTSLCTSGKFCESSGWPEIFNDKFNKCNNFFSPQTGISEPNNYLENIDIDSFLKNVDNKYNKCSHEKKDFKLCNSNDKQCEISKSKLQCYNDIVKKDYYSVKDTQNNTENTENKQETCMKNDEISNIDIANKFFRPTKRRDVLEW